MADIVKSTSLLEQLATQGKCISSNEERMVVASEAIKISRMDKTELAKQSINLMKWVSIDLGIHASRIDETEREYLQARFVQVISNYFTDLTLAEVKVAFDLLLVGELDDYLPKEKNGEPRREHYQMFNADFVTRVLSAFRQRKMAFSKKVTLLLPEKAEEISEEKKQELHDNFCKILERIFTSLSKAEDVHEWELTEYIYRIMLEACQLPDPKPTHQDYLRAKNICSLDRSLSLWVREEINTLFDQGKAAPALELKAQSIKRMRLMRLYMKKHPEQVQTILNYYNGRNNRSN